MAKKSRTESISKQGCNRVIIVTSLCLSSSYAIVFFTAMKVLRSL